MILIKLGGSIITNKEKPLTANRLAIRRITSSLRKIKEPLIVVHGGGSYGHYWSVKYDMHTKPSKYSIKGVSVVKNSMVELNRIILQSFLESNLTPYCLPPSDFMFADKPIMKKVKRDLENCKHWFDSRFLRRRHVVQKKQVLHFVW